MKAMRRIVSGGDHPFETPVALDLDSTNLNMSYNCLPCITRARAMQGGFWITNRGRRMTMDELLRGFAINPKDLRDKECVTSRQLRGLIGNSVPVNLMERILLRALVSAKLASQQSLVGRWESLQSARNTLRAMR